MVRSPWDDKGAFAGCYLASRGIAEGERKLAQEIVAVGTDGGVVHQLWLGYSAVRATVQDGFGEMPRAVDVDGVERVGLPGPARAFLARRFMEASA